MDVSRGLGGFPERLLEEVQSRDNLPLMALYADLVCRHPGPPDAPVCELHQSDDNYNLDVSSSHIVRMPSLCCKASG